MTPLPESLDVETVRALVAKLRGGTIAKRPQETFNQAWDLAGYFGTYLPEGTPVMGSTATAPQGPLSMLTDYDAEVYLDRICGQIEASDGNKLQALPAIPAWVYLELAKWLVNRVFADLFRSP
jgi:hypothetical protein